MDKSRLNKLLEISKSLKLLYVEDDDEIREFTSNLLEDFFDTIDLAVDGEEGIRKYLDFYENNGYYYDLVISDVKMPNMNGVDMSKAINEINRDQPILIISSYRDSNMLISLINAGINNFMQKPTRGKDFIIALSKITEDIAASKMYMDRINKIEELNRDLMKKIKWEIKKNSTLEELAATDKLTGVYNRSHLDKVLDFGINKSIEYKDDISIIFIDIDRFKSINDVYGHQVGDLILKEFAKTIQNNIRDKDTFGRWGGEEFLIICHETNIDGALILAENLRLKIENKIFDHVENITSSFGVAALEDGDNTYSLVKKADKALYKAKYDGRNRVCV